MRLINLVFVVFTVQAANRGFKTGWQTQIRTTVIQTETVGHFRIEIVF